jgi:hypothetical protein
MTDGASGFLLVNHDCIERTRGVNISYNRTSLLTNRIKSALIDNFESKASVVNKLTLKSPRIFHLQQEETNHKNRDYEYLVYT